MHSRFPWAILGIILALLAGAALRLIWPCDIEYKADEAWTFQHSRDAELSWIGMPSSVDIPNPGMSLWVFMLLQRVSGAEDPPALARAVQMVNIVALLLLVVFAFRHVSREEREAWLWAAALVAVNPLAVLFHRKIWPPCVLPLLTLAMLYGWWYRRRRGAAFLWGLFGVCLGQIHMAGFFFAAGFVLWALLFDRPWHSHLRVLRANGRNGRTAGVSRLVRGLHQPAYAGRSPRTGAFCPLALSSDLRDPELRTQNSELKVAWGSWLLGSVLGTLPMLPWIVHLLTQPSARPVNPHRWVHACELKFWMRWFTESFGLGIDYTFGPYFRDFLRYPLLAGQSTYLVAVLHGILAALAVLLMMRATRTLWRRRERWRDLWIGRTSASAFTQNAALWGFGLLLTLSSFSIHRHYMIVLFPLEFLWVARLALASSEAEARSARLGRVLLLALWCAQLGLSANMLAYIHSRQNFANTEYGIPYGAQAAAR